MGEAQVRRAATSYDRMSRVYGRVSEGSERRIVRSHRRFPAFVDRRPIDAASWIDRVGFDVIERRPTRMWGLAVDLVRASPRR